MHAYETKEDGFKLLINGEVVTEDRAVLMARKSKGRKRGRPRKNAAVDAGDKKMTNPFKVNRSEALVEFLEKSTKQ